MPLQENNPETSTSPFPEKKRAWLKAQFRNKFVFCKAAPFIFVLVVSYIFMEAPVGMLMSFLTSSQANWTLPKAAAMTNLQDYLSDLFKAIVCEISKSYSGCFTIITFCTAVSTMGLMLLWISATSEFDMVYVAIFLLALGRASQDILKDFLKDNLDEKLRSKRENKSEPGNRDNKEKQDEDSRIRTNIWWYPAVFAGIILTVAISWVADTIKDIFRFAALLMGGTYLIFYVGCACQSYNSHEDLQVQNTSDTIFRICKSIYRKWKLRTAKVEAQYSDSDVCTQGEEMEAGLRRVEEVRAVKSWVPLICLGFTFIAYSLVVATGNTFFVEQTSNLKPSFTNFDDTPILLIAQSIVRRLSVFICWLKSYSFTVTRNGNSSFLRFKSITATIIRIGIGMVCAIICCIIAWKVEFHRLSLLKKEGILGNRDREISMTTKALIPQFLLLGMAEGLVEDGLTNLFHHLASKSMCTFENSFTLIVIGTGKLLTIPVVLLFGHLFKETANTSHLDKYYLILAISNSVSLLAFVCISFSFRYECKEECSENGSEIEMEPKLEHARQEEPKEVNAAEENLGTRKLIVTKSIKTF